MAAGLGIPSQDVNFIDAVSLSPTSIQITFQVLSAQSVASNTIQGITDAVDSPALLLKQLYLGYSSSVQSVAIASNPAIVGSLDFSGTVYTNPFVQLIYQQLSAIYAVQDAIDALTYNASASAAQLEALLGRVEARFLYVAGVLFK